MEKDGFSGWVKWVIVIAALMTIANGLYDLGKGLVSGFKSGSEQSAPSQKSKSLVLVDSTQLSGYVERRLAPLFLPGL